MCVNCITSSETLILNAGGLATAAWYGAQHLLDRVAGRGPGARRSASRAATRDFARSLGLDPDAVLGPDIPDDVGSLSTAGADLVP